jgi:hypothetical protein
MAQDLATSIKLLAAQSRQSQLIGSTTQTLSGCSPLLMHPSRVCDGSGVMSARDLTNSTYTKGRQT